MRKALHDMIAELLGLDGGKVVWTYQNAPTLVNPFVTLTIMNRRDLSRADIVKVTGKIGVYRVSIPQLLTLTVDYYGVEQDNPVDILNDMVHMFQMPTIIDKYTKTGFAFYDASPVVDLTVMLKNFQKYDLRASVDLFMGYRHEIIDNAGYFDRVSIKEMVSDGSVDEDGIVKIIFDSEYIATGTKRVCGCPSD